jgi:phage tail sheath protein FI
MVPASHIMLRTIALNDQVAYPWFAPAGLRRGVVNNATSVGYLSSEGEFVPAPLGQGVRDVMYPNRVNPIVIQPNGGIVVFGQKTLSISATALDRINVARLIVYIRKQLEVLVKPYFFEPNDTLTRNEVKQDVEGFFNELVGQRALYDFLVVCDSSNNTPERIDRNELWIDIAIKPVKAIEFIYIPIRIKNTGEALA